MTSKEDPGPAPPRGSDAGPPSGADVPRLFSRVVDLGGGIDPLDLAGEDGFVWHSPGGALVGVGQAARVPVGTGPGRIERAAEAVAALLDAVEVDDPGGRGLGPAAVGALPFHPATPGELVVPALLLRNTPDGRTWAVVTGPAPFAPPGAADLLHPAPRHGLPRPPLASRPPTGRSGPGAHRRGPVDSRLPATLR